MVTLNVNDIMAQLTKGEISMKDAVEKTCNFICKNYRVFGLEKYDEDFRSEILLIFLEKGQQFLENYRPELGDYFGYLCMVIKSQVQTHIRSIAKKKVRESFVIQNAPIYVEEKEHIYSSAAFTPVKTTEEKRKLVYTPIPQEVVRQTLTRIAKENKNKKLIIIALKTSFYLTDEHISRISSFYKVKEEIMQQIFQFFKNLLLEKADRKNRLQERRNIAFFHQKNYEKRLELVHASEKHYNNEALMDELEQMLNKHHKSWLSLTKKLESGCVMLRPTNKMIADYLGLCERQVQYYINRFRDEVE